MAERLRAVAATPLAADLADLIRDTVPGLDLVVEQELLPRMRFPADFDGDPSFTRTAEQQRRFDGLLAQADVLYGLPDVDPAALRRVADENPRLRWVHTMAAGGGAQVKAAGLDAEQLARILFTTSAGVHGDTLAEFAVFGVLAGAKHLGRLRELQAAREWPMRWEMGQVAEQRVLVLGLGGIGRVVATRLAGLGAEVIGAARTTTAADGVARVLPIGELASVTGQVDAIVSTLPGTAATTGLIGTDLLARVKPGVTLVNVGRGTVVDEPALVAALLDGRVGFAALDVFAVEPLPASSLLWDLPNVVISPHTAGLSSGEERRIAELFADNARRLLDGRPLRNRVDTVEFY